MPNFPDTYFTVASSSMSPVLNPGDKITLEPVESSEIIPGLVVVFRSAAGKMIVHRIVKRSGFVIQTAGDSLRKFDKPVHVYDVLGKVKEIPVKKPLSKWGRIIRAVKRRISNQP